MKQVHILLLFALLLLAPAVPAADTGGDSWSSQWRIDLSRPTPSDNFPVKVSLSPAIFDFAGAQAHGEDLRFADEDRTSFAYWIESWDPLQGAVVWVNVPESGTRSFYMLSGNPAAEAESDGAAVFTFFDDFSGPSLDTGRWTATGGGSATFANGILISTGKKGLFGTTAVPGIYDKVLEVRGKFHASSGNDVDIGFGRLSGTNLWAGAAEGEWINAHGWEGTGMTLRNAGDTEDCYNMLYPATPLWDSSGYHTYSLSFEPDRMAVEKDYEPYVTYNTTGCHLATDTLPVELILDHSDEQPDYPQYVDWIRVRPAADPEPEASVTKLGSAPAAAPQKTGTSSLVPLVPVMVTFIFLIIIAYIVYTHRHVFHRKTPAEVIPRPAVSMTKEAAFGDPGGIELEITNTGSAEISSIRVTVNPPADMKRESTVHELAGLGPAESRIFPVTFFPPAKGTYVLKVVIEYEVWGLKHTLEFPERVKVK
ncbi:MULTISPECIES: DUF2341 domain-containing protein [unclassified Methanoregula]|uniref:DUF2341 domain-containing protein n=1 Tax=unclassified Methanoregula TaxID=2649730 RepID=UPI0009D42259|nr:MULTISPECIES: DUF2341 domain-containing protein [unclassified Methanoregula]OPX62176.1 MAG: hypothetical protein A4E33_02442 [Methanoregula sp. PtaB.Bin085]OPY35615.1 MAG: hypothetical protein A4E34_00615 [Methanoregula sp. PtaU1.Bin006]